MGETETITFQFNTSIFTSFRRQIETLFLFQPCFMKHCPINYYYNTGISTNVSLDIVCKFSRLLINSCKRFNIGFDVYLILEVVASESS